MEQQSRQISIRFKNPRHLREEKRSVSSQEIGFRRRLPFLCYVLC